MKISLQQVKNILVEVRNIDWSKLSEDELDPFTMAANILEVIDGKTINNVCRIITGKNDVDYSTDLLGEEGALEVISDFLLSIISKWENSKNFQMLIKTYITKKITKEKDKLAKLET